MLYLPTSVIEKNSGLFNKIKKDLTKKLKNRINILGYLNKYPKLKEFVIKVSEKNKWTTSKTVRVLIFKDSPYCSICEKVSEAKHLSIRTPLSKFCSIGCSNKDEQKIARVKQTNIKRYGGNSPSSDIKVWEKQRETMLKRYGVKHSGESIALQKKAANTLFKNTGKTIADLFKEWKDRFKEQHGFFPGHSKEARLKANNTIIARFGSRSNIYTKEVRQKMSEIGKALEKKRVGSSFLKKDHLINNKTFSIQGYEGIALDWLYNEKKIDLNSIRIPKKRFQYLFKGSYYSYLPDIKIGKCIIEVKSDFTIGLKNKNKEIYYKNMAKARALKNLGYDFLFLLIVEMNRGRKEFLITPFPATLKFKEALWQYQWLCKKDFLSN